MRWRSYTFAGRLVRRLIWMQVLLTALVTWMILDFAFQLMHDEATARYESVLALTDEKVEHMLTAVEVAAANNVDEIERSLTEHTDIYRTLEGELKVNPHVIGCAIAFIPNFDKRQGKWFEPYVVRRDNGKMERMQLGGDDHDYTKSDWYKTVMSSNKGHWSDPYFDQDGAQKMLCTYALPVHDETGRIVGVFAADIDLDWLKVQMKEIDRMNNDMHYATSGNDTTTAIHSIILSRDGKYIVCDDSKRVLNKSFADYTRLTPDSTDDYVGQQMLLGKKGNAKMTGENDKTTFVFYGPLERTGWSMAVMVPNITINLMGYVMGIFIVFLMGIELLAVVLVCRFTIRRFTKPLRFLANSTDEVAKGHFDTPLPFIKFNDEIHRLRDSFEKMQYSLAKYIGELKTTTAQKASMERELDIAHGIQMAMIPVKFDLPEEGRAMNVFGALKPAKAVGGDLYNFNVSDGKLFFCIGDVSGKGVPASLVMTVISTMFYTLTVRESQPEMIVTSLNKAVCLNNESGMFVTFFVGVIDLKTGRMQYTNAGHDAPLLIANNGKCKSLEVEANLPIGVLPDMTFKLQETTLEPGTTLFLYTDGLTEAEDKTHAQFGQHRLIEKAEKAFAQEQKPTMEEFVNDITEAVQKFVGDAEQSDDLTMLAIQYNN